MSEYRILVTGDRHWTNVQVISDALSEATEYFCPQLKVILINGGATGADTISAQEAKKRGWEVVTVEADWGKYGKAAGPRRNKEMLKLKPQEVLAFHDDLSKSKGTKDMVKQAQTANKPVTLYNSKGVRTQL